MMAASEVFTVLLLLGEIVFHCSPEAQADAIVVIAKEGEVVNMLCDPTGEAKFTWYIKDPTNQANRVVVYDALTDNYGYYGHLGGNRAFVNEMTGTLTIQSVEVADDFLYYCNRGVQDLYAVHNLTVTVIPETLSLDPQLPTDYVPVGTVLNNTCLLERVKPPASNLDWQLHGKFVTEQGDLEEVSNGDGTVKQTRQLQLTLKEDHHNKVLVCRAVINGNTTYSERVSLKVGYGPSGTPVISPSNQVIRLNEDARLTCDTSSMVLGSPDTHWYSWKKLGESGIVHNTTSPTYSIKADDQDDAGNFTCFVGNMYGQSEESASASLSIQGVAPAVKNSTLVPAIAGGVGGLVLIIVLIVIIVFIRKRSKPKNAAPPYRMTKGPDGFTIDEDHVRPLAQGSPAINGVEKSPVDHDEYATVDDVKGERRARPVPQPRPSKAKGSSTAMPEPTYAEPNVNIKENKKKKKDKKKKAIPEPEYAEPNSVRNQVKNPGPENMYMNADNNNLTPQQRGRYRTPEGQLYAEVSFDDTPSPSAGRRAPVRRTEEPTEYAKVDFTKTAPPPRDDDYY